MFLQFNYRFKESILYSVKAIIKNPLYHYIINIMSDIELYFEE